MAINFNNLNQNRAGIIGLDDVITQTPSAPLQTAFFKTKTQKLLEDMQKSGEIDQPTKIEGGAAGVGETSQEIPQNIKDDILNFIEKGIIEKKEPGAGDFLKDSLPDKFKNIDSQTLQNFIDQQVSLGLPKDNLTAMNISNFDDLFGTKTIVDSFGNTRVISGSERPNIFTGQTDVATGLPVGQVPFDRILDSRLPGFQFSPKPTFGQRLSSGINQLKTNLGTGFGKVKSDIGSFIGSGGFGGMVARGLGGILQALLPKESPIDKFNKQFSVQNLGGDPYGYYDSLRAGNLTGQDPFGVNTVSGFGDYQKHYRDYLNAFNNQTKFKGLYTPKKTSKFADLEINMTYLKY